MLRIRPISLALGVATLLALPMGCVVREEKIRIMPDGAVLMNVDVEGGVEELTGGDAMPSVDLGWEVVTAIETEDDEEKLVISAFRRFEAGEELPHTFADPDDADADLYLDFPTTLRIEERPDGIYYFFRRVYPPRRWAYLQTWNDQIFDDDVKKIGDKPVEELTFDEQVRIASAFAVVEATKQLEFMQLAIAESLPDLPIEHNLMARQALLTVHRDLHDNDGFEQIIEKCGELPEEAKSRCFDGEAERILTAAYEACTRSLREDAGVNRRGMAAFDRAYQRAARYHELTEQLGGHTFEIEITMPGVVIAHSLLDPHTVFDMTKNRTTVTGGFEGKWIRDRGFEIAVVSRLDHEAYEVELNRTGEDDE